MPLPKEAKDFVQARCVINQVPNQESGSHISSYLVEPRKVGSLQGAFAIELPPGNYTVMLEWRKLGSGIQKWSTYVSSGGGINSGLSVYAVFEIFEHAL